MLLQVQQTGSSNAPNSKSGIPYFQIMWIKFELGFADKNISAETYEIGRKVRISSCSIQY